MADSSITADLLIIGFGKGGKTLAATAGRQGRRVVMVERSSAMYGGTCINVGCVPTKALVHSAESKRDSDSDQTWYADAVERELTLTALLRGKNFEMLDAIDTVTVVTGEARFDGPRDVSVTAGSDRLRISAETIVINTGSEPILPNIPGLELGPRILTNVELLRERELPARLAIIGGGSLGLEFASIYAQFGSRVTVIEAGPAFLRREDADVAAAALDILTGAGVVLVAGTTITRVQEHTSEVVLQCARDGASFEIAADVVLVATGRRPATAGLQLENAGVDVSERGAVVVDGYLATTQPGIYAVGDVNGGPQFTYISLDDSRIVAEQLGGRGSRTTNDRSAVPTTVFMSPPLASVGLTEGAARAAGHRVRIAMKSIAEIAAMPRARMLGDTRGLMKFVIDADTDLLLGAVLLSVDSQEIINTVALAIRHGVTATELRDTIYTHPSSTEALNDVLATIVRTDTLAPAPTLEDS